MEIPPNLLKMIENNELYNQIQNVNNRKDDISKEKYLLNIYNYISRLSSENNNFFNFEHGSEEYEDKEPENKKKFYKKLKILTDYDKYIVIVNAINLFIDHKRGFNFKIKDIDEHLKKIKIIRKNEPSKNKLTEANLELLIKQRNKIESLKKAKNYIKKKGLEENKDITDVLSIIELGNKLNLEIKRFKTNILNSKNTINFGNISFGNIKEDTLLEINEYDIDKVFKKEINKIEEKTNIIDEIINISITGRSINQNPTDEKQYLINFYSNILYNVVYKKLETLSENEQIYLYQDIQKLVVTMSLLLKAIESVSPSKRTNKLLIYLNISKNDKIQVTTKNKIKRLLNVEPFSEDSLISKEELKDIQKNGFRSFKKDFSKDLDFNNDNVFKELDKDAMLTMKKVRGKEVSKSNTVNYVKDYFSYDNSPLFNILSLMNNFIFNYDMTIFNGIYHQPRILFDTNFNELEYIIEEIDKNIENNNLYAFLKNLSTENSSIQYERIFKETTSKSNSKPTTKENIKEEDYIPMPDWF